VTEKGELIVAWAETKEKREERVRKERRREIRGNERAAEEGRDMVDST
jgi:hypothetical protein